MGQNSDSFFFLFLNYNLTFENFVEETNNSKEYAFVRVPTLCLIFQDFRYFLERDRDRQPIKKQKCPDEFRSRVDVSMGAGTNTFDP